MSNVTVASICKALDAALSSTELARSQLAARDAALDAVMALALKQRDGGDMDLERAGENMYRLR